MDTPCRITPTGLPPVIKWAGGKEKELPLILPHVPHPFNNYYEPFVGGGAVFAAMPAGRHYINDLSEELIGLYRSVAEQDAGFFLWMERIAASWSAMPAFAGSRGELTDAYLRYRAGELTDAGVKAFAAGFVDDNEAALQSVLAHEFEWKRGLYASELKKNLARKLLRMRRIEQDRQPMPPDDVCANIETAFMSALYMYYRGIYNDRAVMQSREGLSTAVFVFIRNYAYSGMFRYNDRGEFNVPYGGMGYNRKLLAKKMAYYRSEPLRRHLASARICNMDFEDFLRANPPGEDDFVFLDPPYDSEFSTYARHEFGRDDQRRLAHYLTRECRGRWMLVIKNTPLIAALYDHPGLTVRAFDKRYLVSFMNRNEKRAEHLIITNYR